MNRNADVRSTRFELDQGGTDVTIDALHFDDGSKLILAARDDHNTGPYPIGHVYDARGEAL